LARKQKNLVSGSGILALTVEKAPPLWYRIAVNTPRFGRPLLERMRDRNKLNRAAYFKFHESKMAIPLYWLSPCDVTNVFGRRIRRFAEVCSSNLGEHDFIDCGANLGTFAAQFTRFSPHVHKLIAIEPNPELFPLMRLNLSNAARAQETVPLNAAVSDKEGRCRLVAPAGKWAKDAFYIEEDPNGDIPIITLSTVLQSCNMPRVAIKLDVEGAEVPTLMGGAEQIGALDRVVLFVEFHKDVLARIGMSDREMLGRIDDLRQFRWIDSATDLPIDRSRSIFDQSDPRQCDLIAIG
jgi:FkbM family methyltransferase